MRFTAALRRFIAPSKHKMPGREACIRVGTPPLHFYRQLPVKPGNIPPISCSRERSHPAISNSLSLSLALSIPLSLLPNAVTGSLLSLLFHLPARLTPFLISRILFAVSRPVSSRKVRSPLLLHSDCRHAHFGSLLLAITATWRIGTFLCTLNLVVRNCDIGMQ